MMMRMLEAGGLSPLTDNIRQADDDNPEGYYELEAIKRIDQHAAWLNNANGKAVKAIYRLLYELPPQHVYKVIFMERHIAEVIASQKVMLSRNRRIGSSLSAEVLTSAFHKELEQAHLWMQRQPNLQYLSVQYNETIEQPHVTASAVCDFLELDLDVAKMADVVDQTLYRQRVSMEP
jgi:hypothetical protein